MYGWNHGDWMFGHDGWMIFGWLWMALIWLVPLLLLFALFKYLFGSPKSSATKGEKPAMTSMDILEEVYARGEINREEFLQKRDDLKKQ